MRAELTLDAEQRMAVETSARAAVVVAGAGSGKTEVVARRVERILSGSLNDSFRVLALSYTVRAADELRDRFRDRLGDAYRRVDTDTVHGFALNLVRQFGTRIGLPSEPEILTRNEDRIELLLSWLEESQYPEPDESPSEIFERLDRARARNETTDLLDQWRDALEATGALDFPAMLDSARDLLAPGSWVGRHMQRLYEHVVVDEAQNLTPAQYELLRLLIGDADGDHVNVMVVGDERQSIVTFAGADPRLISTFEDEYRAQRIQLHRNYRSAEHIIRVAKTIEDALGQPTEEYDVRYAAEGSVRIRECQDEEGEGDFVADWVSTLLEKGAPSNALAPGESSNLAPEDIAVLSRSGAALRFTRESLDARGVHNAFASTEDDWVLSTLARMVVDVSAFRGSPEHRSIQRRMEAVLGIGESDWDKPELVLQQSGASSLVPLFKAKDPAHLLEVAEEIESDDPDWPDDMIELRKALDSFLAHTDAIDRTFPNFRHHIARCQRGDRLSGGVRLLTVHKAQGREFRAVAIIGCNDGQFPDFRAATDEERTSELRAFYVAASRPTRVLLLTRAETRRTRYGPRLMDPSPFLDLISESP